MRLREGESAPKDENAKAIANPSPSAGGFIRLVLMESAAAMDSDHLQPKKKPKAYKFNHQESEGGDNNCNFFLALGLLQFYLNPTIYKFPYVLSHVRVRVH
jgi:hypothetical protein